MNVEADAKNFNTRQENEPKQDVHIKMFLLKKLRKKWEKKLWHSSDLLWRV